MIFNHSVTSAGVTNPEQGQWANQRSCWKSSLQPKKITRIVQWSTLQIATLPWPFPGPADPQVRLLSLRPSWLSQARPEMQLISELYITSSVFLWLSLTLFPMTDVLLSKPGPFVTTKVTWKIVVILIICRCRSQSRMFFFICSVNGIMRICDGAFFVSKKFHSSVSWLNGLLLNLKMC